MMLGFLSWAAAGPPPISVTARDNGDRGCHQPTGKSTFIVDLPWIIKRVLARSAWLAHAGSHQHCPMHTTDPSSFVSAGRHKPIGAMREMEVWTADPLRQFMAASRWMGRLAEPLREHLVGMAIVRAFAPGETIYLQDDPPFGLATVLDGTVRLTRSTRSGRETLVHVAQAGCWFGELAVLLDCPTQVAATAREPATILVFPAGPLQRLVAAEPEHYAPLARSASRALRTAAGPARAVSTAWPDRADRDQAAGAGGGRPYGPRHHATAIQPEAKRARGVGFAVAPDGQSRLDAPRPCGTGRTWRRLDHARKLRRLERTRRSRW